MERILKRESTTGDSLNLASHALAESARHPDRAALVHLGGDSWRTVYTYGVLADLAVRFDQVLADFGVRPQDRVFTLLDKGPELTITALGTLRAGSVFGALFPSFGPDPIATRLRMGEAALLVTTRRLYERARSAIDRVDSIKAIIFVDSTNAHDRDFWTLVDNARTRRAPFSPTPETPAFVQFTSGTTGEPKAAIHTHGALPGILSTARQVLDLRPGDIYWCTADPGWITGLVYGVLAPLLCGVTSILDGAPFAPELWLDILERERVNVLYTSPTALRMLRALCKSARPSRYGGLRHVAAVGEPLSPSLVGWSKEVLGVPAHDTWWQTETGAIMIANCRGMDIKPGSMGLVVPGIDAQIAELDSVPTTLITGRDEVGELVLRAGWPSMFRGYLGEASRYRACFRDDWYLTGDLVRRDEDGYFWFVGRRDDLIKTAGHLVGPTEVEHVLSSHPAVLEAAVVGIPDDIAGELIKAYVVRTEEGLSNPALQQELLGFARERLGPALAPRSLEFCTSLPKNPAGKILRRQLR